MVSTALCYSDRGEETRTNGSRWSLDLGSSSSGIESSAVRVDEMEWSRQAQDWRRVELMAW